VLEIVSVVPVDWLVRSVVVLPVELLLELAVRVNAVVVVPVPAVTFVVDVVAVLTEV